MWFSITRSRFLYFYLFFFNDPPTTEIYTLSLHDALPILALMRSSETQARAIDVLAQQHISDTQSVEAVTRLRSEEHTSELQSHSDLVCRLLLEKKKPITPRVLRSTTSPRLTTTLSSRRSY